MQNIQEIREKRKSKQLPTTAIPATTSEVTASTASKMSHQYLAVISTAVTIVSVKEKESPGSFRYVLNEIFVSNNIPFVCIPETVISGFDGWREREEEEIRKANERPWDSWVTRICPYGSVKISVNVEFS